jgi:hypothetical protein
MSIFALSTELDENILRRLAQPELDSVSRTSKYYRTLAEPLLYEDLVFSEGQESSLACLLVTCLRRKELAKHIRLFSCKVRKRYPQDSLWDERLIKEMLDNIEAVKGIVHKIAAPLRRRQLELEWMGSIYSMPSSMDGAIAVILCMATNLEYVELATSPTVSTGPTFIRHLLEKQWADIVDTGTTFPFCKLKTLWDSDGSALILPTMEASILNRVNRASSPR